MLFFIFPFPENLFNEYRKRKKEKNECKNSKFNNMKLISGSMWGERTGLDAGGEFVKERSQKKKIWEKKSL